MDFRTLKFQILGGGELNKRVVDILSHDYRTGGGGS